MTENIFDECVRNKNFPEQREFCFNGNIKDILTSIIKFNCMESLRNIKNILLAEHIEILFQNNKLEMGLNSIAYGIDIKKYYNYKENGLYLREVAMRYCNFDVIMFLISKGFIFTHKDLEIIYLKNPNKDIVIRKLLNPKFNKGLFDVNMTRILDICIYLGDTKMMNYLKKIGAKFKERHVSLMKIYMGTKIKSSEKDEILLTPDEILMRGKGLIEIAYIASSLCLPVTFDFKDMVDQISKKREFDNQCYNSVTCLGNEIKFIPKEKFYVDNQDKYGFELEEVIQFKENPYTRIPLNFDMSDINKKKEFYDAMGYSTKIIWDYHFIQDKIDFEHDLGIKYITRILYENFILSKFEYERIETMKDFNVMYNIRKIVEPDKMFEFGLNLNYI